MNLDDWIECLEDLRDEHGGNTSVELAADLQTVLREQVVAVNVSDGYGAEYVIQIG